MTAVKTTIKGVISNPKLPDAEIEGDVYLNLQDVDGSKLVVFKTEPTHDPKDVVDPYTPYPKVIPHQSEVSKQYIVKIKYADSGVQKKIAFYHYKANLWTLPNGDDITDIVIGWTVIP